MNQHSLTSPRLILEPRSPAQVLAWVDSLPPDIQKEVSPVWLDAIHRLSQTDPWYCGFTILHPESNTEIGSCGFKGPPNSRGIVEIAYGINDEWQRQGLATEAVGLLADFCRQQPAVKTIRAHTKPDNIASARVLTKVGFNCVGLADHPEDGTVCRWDLPTRQTLQPKHFIIPFALLTLLQHSWYYTSLPDQVATHFGPGGKPDDWMQKSTALLVLAGFQLFFPLLLLSITRLIKKLPSGAINIPNRRYWLAPERREASLRWLQQPMSGIAGSTAVLLIAANHFTYRANLRGGHLEEGPFFCCLTLYLAVTLWQVIAITRRFGRLPPITTENQ